MGDVVVQSGLLTFVFIVVGSVAIGGIAVYLTFRWRKGRQISPMSSMPDADSLLYLAFSRFSHRLKSSGEIVRGHLRGFTDELPGDAERWRVARRTIFDEASEISTMVQRLDLLVRIGLTDKPLVLEPVDVPSTIEELMLGLAPAADEKEITITGVESGLAGDSRIVLGDSSALREVFSNVLENAVVHCGSGAAIGATVDGHNGDLRIQIRDTGVGMSAVQLDELFTPGSYSHVPGVRRGTGMGMYLSKMLVELHGGTVSAESVQGEGTCIRIELPAKQ